MMGDSYRCKIRNLEVKVSWFGIQFKICSFCSNSFEKRDPLRKLAKAFYGLGAIVVMIFAMLVIFQVLFTCSSFICNIFEVIKEQLYENVDSQQRQNVYLNNNKFGLKLVIPGVNVPISHVVHIWVGGLLSLIFHELGHSLAANLGEVQVDQFRLCLYAFLIPVASTQLDQLDYDTVGFMNRIQIITAGVYHNIIICGCGICLLLLLPILFTPLYKTNQGVYVLDVSPGCSMIKYRDTIIQIDGAAVNNIFQLKTLINAKFPNKNLNNNESVPRISTIKNESQGSDEKITNSTIGDGLHNKISATSEQQSFCLSEDVTKTISSFVCSQYEGCQQSQFFCFSLQMKGTEGKCIDTKTTKIYLSNKGQNNSCLEGDILAWPLEQIQSNKVQFSVLVRSYQNSDEHWVVLTGQVQGVLTGVSLSNYVPRSVIFPVCFPLVLEQFLQYLAGISAGIGFINLLPFNCFDGGLLWQEIFFQAGRYFVKTKKKFRFTD